VEGIDDKGFSEFMKVFTKPHNEKQLKEAANKFAGVEDDSNKERNLWIANRADELGKKYPEKSNDQLLRMAGKEWSAKGLDRKEEPKKDSDKKEKVKLPVNDIKQNILYNVTPKHISVSSKEILMRGDTGLRFDMPEVIDSLNKVFKDDFKFNYEGRKESINGEYLYSISISRV